MRRRGYGEALHDSLQTSQANGWAWDEIEEGHLRAYRNQTLYHPSSVTGRAYSARTITGSLRWLAMFYSWAFRRGLIARLPFDYDTVRTPISADAHMLAHLHTGEALPALDLTAREYRSIPTALSVEDLRRVRAHLGPRDALITDLAVSTGARRMEVLGLTVNDIPDGHPLGDAPFVAISITGKVGGGAPCRCRSRSSTASIATSASCENLCSVAIAWQVDRESLVERRLFQVLVMATVHGDPRLLLDRRRVAHTPAA